MQVNLIVKAIAQGFEEVNKKQKSLGDQAEKTQSKFSKAGEGFKSFTKGLASVGVAAGITAIAIKKLFDVAAQGAAIRQQAESFDLLIEKTGATGDILEELRVSAKGTVTDFELMSSTATLLAGASGDLARELAQSTPELLEIAKAANKLNPALGSTTFLYDSLARGIKRASPLILDNLGLIIKVGDANEAMAKSLGKTVSELTANDKAQAILNDTLRAGQVLIEQVGGNTNSATDAFARMTAAIKNQTDAGKASLGEFLAPAAEAIALLITWEDRLTDALAENETQVVKTAEDYAEYVVLLVNAARLAGKLTKVEADLIIEQLALGGGLRDLNVELRLGNALIGNLGDNMERAGIKSETLFDIYRDGTPIIDGWMEAQIRAKEAAEGLSVAVITQEQRTALLNTKLAELRMLIGSDLIGDYDAMVKKTGELETKSETLRGKISELEGSWKANTTAGQEELDKLRGELDKTKEKIDEIAAKWDEQTKRFVLNMIIQRAAIDGLTTDEFDLILAVAEDFGLIDQAAVEALEAADLAFTVLEGGHGVEVAKRVITNFQEKLRDTGLAADEAMAVSDAALGKFAGSPGVVLSKETLDDIKGKVDSIAGEYDIKFNITTTGNLPAAARAHGGPLAPVTKVGEQGFEYIIGGQVIPHAQSVELERSGILGTASGGGGDTHVGGITVNPSFGMDEELLAELVIDRLSERTRAARASRSGLEGT